MGVAPDPSTFVELFSTIPDRRIERTKLHSLPAVLLLCLCGVICGADSLVAIERFGELRKKVLNEMIPFPNGIPSHDTIGRVLAGISPDVLERMFLQWMSNVAKLTEGEVVAIDGKTLRRAWDRANGGKFVHMVSAWATANRMVLAQVKTDEKSNEIAAIPQLLELLEIKGCIITIDAMGCQKEIARTVIEAEADYIFTLKDNQPKLARAVEEQFERVYDQGTERLPPNFHETQEYGHGRVEVRRCWVMDVPDGMPEREKWDGLSTLIRVETERSLNGKTTTATHHYISSRSCMNPEEALAYIRSHWGIENSLHWVLDVAFCEDDSRVRIENAAENFAVLRHTALNLLRNVKGSKVGIKIRRQEAGWSDDSLKQVLTSCAY
jgi:predicted transposase YbfD/YdcC